MRLFKRRESRSQAAEPSADVYAFRRSRTLTGTTSSRVATSAESRGQLKTERLKLHENRQFRRKFMRVLAIVALVALILVYIAFNYIGSVPVTYTQPGTSPPVSAYMQSAHEYLAAHPLQRFGFSIDARQLESFLQAQHPEITAASLSKAWYGGQSALSVIFRRPLVVWRSRTQTFFVDSEGIAFGYNHFTSPLVTVTDQSGITPDQNQAIASARFIRFLGLLVADVNAIGKGAVASVIIPPATREVDLKLAGRSTLFKTHIDRDPKQQAEDIKRSLDFFDARRVTPQYLDVRVAGKAFYQ